MFAAALSFSPPCAAPAAEEVPQRAQACTVCHGPGGNSTDPAVPSLAGQPAQFISIQLFLFPQAHRKDPLMSPIPASRSNVDRNGLPPSSTNQTPASPP